MVFVGKNFKAILYFKRLIILNMGVEQTLIFTGHKLVIHKGIVTKMSNV